MRTSLSGLSRSKLRLWLGAFFLALAIPTAVLIVQAYSQLKWEAFHQYQGLAEELAARIDDGFRQRVAAEEARGLHRLRLPGGGRRPHGQLSAALAAVGVSGGRRRSPA